MRLLSALGPLAAAFLLAGCGYIHFGRLPPERRGDAALEQAYTDLAIQQKILKQELELARKERDTLRTALDTQGVNLDTASLAKRLEDTTRELAAVRASALESSRAASPSSGAGDAGALQAENARLQRELDEARQQNATLAEKLTASVAAQEETRAALAQLNSEFLVEKERRERAEQTTTALRAQLEAVMARAGRAGQAGADDPAMNAAATSEPTSAPTTPPTPGPLSALQSAKAPPSDAAPTVELRTSAERARAAAAGRTAPAAASQPPRTYTVQPGDTLEKIAAREYGSPEAWGKIYAANADRIGTSGLKPGMVLDIPEHP